MKEALSLRFRMLRLGRTVSEHRDGGLGPALYVTRPIAEAMGGSTSAVELPLAPEEERG
jgi:hypothetical protein